MHSEDTATRLMNLSTGTARSLGSLSAELLSFAIGFISNRATLHHVRRLAYEAADCGLLSPDLAAGIRRVKGVKKIGVRLGNWLTAEQLGTETRFGRKAPLEVCNFHDIITS